MAEPLSVALSIPAYRKQVGTGLLVQVQNMTAYALVRRLRSVTLFADSSSLDWCRNRLLFDAVKHDSEWCLMTDADTCCTHADQIYRMLDEGNRRRAAVIGAPVKMRGRPGFNVQVQTADHVLRYLTPEELAGKVLPVTHIGTALFAIRCGWIVRNWWPGPWFQTTQILDENGPQKLGEDFTFCRAVARRGGLVLADGRVSTDHVHLTSESFMAVEGGPEWIAANPDCWKPGLETRDPMGDEAVDLWGGQKVAPEPTG